MRALGSIALAAAAALVPATANALVVDTLPYVGTPDWTDVQFSGTSMSYNGTSTTMGTAEYVGVWFGWQSGTNTPSWSLGDAVTGNYLSLTTSFGSGSKDWSTYLYDGAYGSGITFAPSNCACYDQPALSGVNLYFGSANPLGYTTQFVPLANLTQPQNIELLMKGGQLTYRINGVAYSGAAMVSAQSAVLVIGDGSGPSPGTSGSMTIHAVSLDTAPSISALPSAVPEPGTWAMMIGGFGLAGGMLRRRRKESVAVAA